MSTLIKNWKIAERFLNSRLAYFFANGNKPYRVKEYQSE